MKYTAIREALEGKRVAWGTHCFSSDIELYEVCGLVGYDYVWIDSEHAPTTLITIKNGIIAANARGCAAFVRAPSHREESIKPILELGPQGIIIPNIKTAAQAEEVVRWCTYPPYGNRGFGPSRAMDYGEMPLTQYLEEANQNTITLIQCESVEGVRNLDEILKVPGIDAIMIGPMDLAGSIGKLADNKHPEVIALIDEIADKCKKAKKPFGLSIGFDMDLCRYIVGKGASFVSMGQHILYFRMMSKKVLKEFHEMEPERGKAEDE